MKTDTGTIVRLETNGKMAALKELIQDSSAPTIIWARYTEELQSICNMIRELNGPGYKRTYARFDGTTSSNEKNWAIEDVQAGKIQFFVGNAKAGGIGITLTRASEVIYFSNTHSYETRIQSEDRVHRSGLKHSVTYTDLVMRGTIDVAILRSLREKRSVANMITEDPVEEWI